MRLVIVFVTVLVGCDGSTTESPSQRLVGEWLFVFPSGERATAISLKSDATYSLSQIVVPTPTSREVEVENGTYTATSTAISVTPTEWSCSGPDPIMTFPYSFVGADLELTEPSGAITFKVDTEPPLSGLVMVETGCFSANGTFTQSVVAPVTN
jgi:hypothetical protein